MGMLMIRIDLGPNRRYEVIECSVLFLGDSLTCNMSPISLLRDDSSKTVPMWAFPEEVPCQGGPSLLLVRIREIESEQETILHFLRNLPKLAGPWECALAVPLLSTFRVQVRGPSSAPATDARVRLAHCGVDGANYGAVLWYFARHGGRIGVDTFRHVWSPPSETDARGLTAPQIAPVGDVSFEVARTGLQGRVLHSERNEKQDDQVIQVTIGILDQAPVLVRELQTEFWAVVSEINDPWSGSGWDPHSMEVLGPAAGGHLPIQNLAGFQGLSGLVLSRGRRAIRFSLESGRKTLTVQDHGPAGSVPLPGEGVVALDQQVPYPTHACVRCPEGARRFLEVDPDGSGLIWMEGMTQGKPLPLVARLDRSLALDALDRAERTKPAFILADAPSASTMIEDSRITIRVRASEGPFAGEWLTVPAVFVTWSEAPQGIVVEAPSLPAGIEVKLEAHVPFHGRWEHLVSLDGHEAGPITIRRQRDTSPGVRGVLRIEVRDDVGRVVPGCAVQIVGGRSALVRVTDVDGRILLEFVEHPKRLRVAAVGLWADERLLDANDLSRGHVQIAVRKTARVVVLCERASVVVLSKQSRGSLTATQHGTAEVLDKKRLQCLGETVLSIPGRCEYDLNYVSPGGTDVEVIATGLVAPAPGATEAIRVDVLERRLLDD